jgi:hypothetical protein
MGTIKLHHALCLTPCLAPYVVYLGKRGDDQAVLRDFDLWEEAALHFLSDVSVGGLNTGGAAARAQNLAVLFRQRTVMRAPSGEKV